MDKIQFLKATSAAKLDLTGKTVCVYKEGYSLPKIDNCEYIEFLKYKSIYTKVETDNLIMVGTNRLFNPANRCELVFEYLQTLSSHINKISIDTSPFIGEPWRLWFHWSFVFGIWLNIKYSYAVETDWQHWFYRDSNTSLIANANTESSVYSDLDLLNTQFEFIQVNNIDYSYYATLKENAFEKYSSPKLIIQFMLKNLNNHFQSNIDFDSYLENKIIQVPDLPVFRFVIEENNRRKLIYNGAIK